MDQQAFKFPDPEKDEQEGEEQEISVEVEDDVEVEVVDDTPEEDRGRKPADEPPGEVTEEELQNYSEKIRKRIQHLGRGYHDERRAKEAALREREELEKYALALQQRLKDLEQTSGKSKELLLAQAKNTLTSQYEAAKKEYRAAYDSGDGDALLAAQEKMLNLRSKLDRVSSFKPKKAEDRAPSQEKPVQQPQPAAKLDEKTEKWYKENSWFGKDDEMTAFALGYHNKLLKEGVANGSDEYYQKLNSRIRQVFPDNFDDVEKPNTRKGKNAQVVAPATRSTAPKKIVLTKSAVALANRLGVPLEEYAKQVAALRKQNDG